MTYRVSPPAGSYRQLGAVEGDEFTLVEAGLPMGRFRKILHSSDGSGWRDMAVAVTSVTPFDSVLSKLDHVWIELPFDRVVAEIERSGSSFRGEFEAGNIFHHPIDSVGAANILTSVRCLHVFLKKDVVGELAAAVHGNSARDLDTALLIGEGDPTLKQMMLAAKQLLFEPDSAFRSEYLARAIAAQLVSRHGRERERHEASQTRTLSAKQQALIREYLHENMDSVFQFADLARLVGLSRAEFFLRFAKTMRMTPNRYLQAIRIERAKELLRRPDLTLAEVALASGFADQSHMTRTFRRLSGTTPATFRRDAA